MDKRGDGVNRNAVKWLYDQLPDLVAKGVMPAETAQRIREHYGPLPQGLGRRMLMLAFGLIGALLVGLGIILIIGHNWDQLSSLTRLLISLGLLVTAQIATGLVLWRKEEGASWLKEGAAVFLTLAVGASIALVGQTYHLVDDFNNYVLVWILLSLPLVYLMDVKGVAGMYLAGVVAWLASVQHYGLMKYWAWLLLLLVLPYYCRLLKIDRYANSAVVLSWLMVLAFISCFSLTLVYCSLWKLWAVLYALLFSCTYFTGLLMFGEAERAWQKPFQTIGVLGGLGMAYLLSFRWIWVTIYHGVSTASRVEYLLAFGFFVLAAGLGIMLVKRGLTSYIPWGAFPVVVGGGYLLAVNKYGMYAAILTNLYLLWVSVKLIVQGVRETRLGSLNAGMLMLMVLILLRFFDISYSFYARGTVFILFGVVFLVVNLVMSRRKDGVTG